MKTMKSITFFARLTFIFAYHTTGCSSREQPARLDISREVGGELDAEQASNTYESIKYKGVVSEIGDVQRHPERVPNFVWRDAAGKKVTFDEWHSKVTILNFWATWCTPCRKEIPDLEAIHNEYGEKGVKVIGVSVDRGPTALSDVASFAEKFEMTYPVVIDNGDLEQLFGNIRAIPTTFIINSEGKVVERLIGMRPKEVFLTAVRTHLK